MTPEWEDGNKAKSVLDFLDGILGLNDEGNVTLGLGTDFDASVATLTGLTDFSDKIPQEKRLSIVHDSIIESRKAEDLTADRVLREIQERQGEYLSRTEEPYVLLTSLSVRYFDQLATVRPYGATITFTRHTPNRFELPDLINRSPRSDYYSTPRQFTTVRVHVRARDEEGAVEAALNRLDFIRGLWNLALTYRRWRVTMGIGYKPVNPVLLGPIHTLHKPDGTPISGKAWWRPKYSPNVSANNIRSKYSAMKEAEKWGRDRISKATFEETLQEIIVQYAHALDEADLQSAFIRLWSILETLTDANSYRTAVDRTLMLFKDTDYRKPVLNRLRDERNQMVHSGHEPERIEKLVYELKKYVDVVLRFMLENVEEWEDLQDYGLFLSLPRDIDEIEKRRRYHDLAHDLLSD